MHIYLLTLIALAIVVVSVPAGADVLVASTVAGAGRLLTIAPGSQLDCVRYDQPQ